MRLSLVIRKLLLKEERTIIAGNRALRRRLRKRPFAFALLGGTGVVLFWRGVWHIADEIPLLQNAYVSLVIGIGILFVSGLMVFQLIGQAALDERIDDLTQAEKELETEEGKLAHEEQLLRGAVQAETEARETQH